MSRSVLFALSAVVTAAVAQSAADPRETFPAVPLAEKRFTYPDLPYQVDTEPELIRGRQYGYNVCNGTTEGQESLCQTAFLNSLEDFCLWGPPEPESLIGDTEGEAVAWCTQPGRGTRLIPQGALQGVQFMRTPDYIQVSGYIDQRLINIEANDWGGEMDPHGADLRGNPLGGLLFSNGFPSNGGNVDSFQQVIEWHNFVGNGFFCFKACDPSGQDDDKYCEHIFDRIGCFYNAPSQVTRGVFEQCLGENQDFPGIYTDEAGVVQTYTQPHTGEITSVYPVRMPESSSCTPFESTDLWPSQPTPSVQPTGSVEQSSVPEPTGGSASSARPTNTRTTPTRSGTADSSEATEEPDNGAPALVFSKLSAFAAVAVGAFLMA